MAKFQLCEFRRTDKVLGPMKADNLSLWERGIARVECYDDTSTVRFVIDLDGKRLEKFHQLRLITRHGFSAIDTESKE